MQDYYQVLGVRRDVGPEDLRRAYVKLAKRHHPDVAPSSSVLSQRLREIQQAYRCLSVAERRAEHDRLLAERERLHFAGQQAIQRRLHRYDRRHPRRAPGVYRKVSWKTRVILVCGIALAGRVALALFV